MTKDTEFYNILTVLALGCQFFNPQRKGKPSQELLLVHPLCPPEFLLPGWPSKAKQSRRTVHGGHHPFGEVSR